MVSPNKSKRKVDTFPKNQPAGNTDAEMSFQGNVIESRDSLSLIAPKGTSLNPFIVPAYVPPPKKLVSIETLMKHTGCKEELHRTLSIQGK